MDIFQSVSNFLLGRSTQIDVVDEHCPNCWGKQTYSGSFYDKMKVDKVNTNNLNEKRGWIEAYAAKHFHTIKLVDRGDNYACPTCEITYDPK